MRSYIFNYSKNFGENNKHYILRTKQGRDLAVPSSQVTFLPGDRALIPLWLAERLSGRIRRPAIDKFFK